jgi:autotransporter-associated beta strand protein
VNTPGPADWFTPGNWNLGVPSGATNQTNVINGTTARIGGAAANAGATLIINSGSTVDLQAAGSLTASSIVIGASSTLLLSGSTAVTVAPLPNGIVLNGGIVRSLISGTLTGDISITNGATGTISVAPGQTLTVTGAWQSPGNQTHVIFGSSVDTGTVAFTSSGPVSASQLSSLEIAGGTLQEGNGHLGDLTGSALSTIVDAGATLDFSNNMLSPIRNLQGTGRVLTGGVTVLEIAQGNFSGSIQGTGQVTAGGVGQIDTIILTGSNSYSGGTYLPGGTLQIGNLGALGSGLITAIGGTLRSTVSGTLMNDIVFGYVGPCCYFGVPPSGRVSAAAGQTLTLGGNSASFGGGDPAIFGSPTDTGTIIFAPSSATVIPFTSIDVAGGTLRAGNSQLGAVTSVGGGQTSVEAGATLDLNGLPLTIAALYGDGRVQTGGANLSLIEGYFGGTIAGAGALHQLVGAPPMILTGSNTYTGGTIIDAGGTLQVGDGGTSGSIIGNVTNNGTFAIKRSDIYTFSGNISGAGTFTQLGTGTTILTGVSTYTGATTVNAGTLQIGDVNSPGARIAGSVVVSAAGTLRGHGTIGGNITNSGGTVAPGGSIGTLTVTGNYTQTGGTLAIEVGPAAASLLNVGGTANLSNASLVLNFNAGNYPAQETVTILHSASLVGSLASVTQSGLPPLRVMNLTQTATDLILTLSTSLIAVSTPATPNQLQIATALNNAFTSAPLAFAPVHDALLSLSIPQQQQALTEISGVILASAPTVIVGQAQAANSVVLDRVFSGAENTTIAAAQSAMPLRLAFAGSEDNLNQLVAQARAAMEDDATSAARTVSDGFWLQGTGDWGSVNGDGNAPGWSSHGGGVLAGYEHVFGDESRLGAAFGYGRADGDEKGDQATTSLDTYRLVFYGGFDDGPLMVGGALDFALDRFGAERPISLGTLTPVATSSHDGNEISASAMAGYRLSGAATGVMPFISADYVYLHQQGFTETGAGALNLSVMPSHFQSLQPEVGMRLGHVYALEDDVFIVPVLTIGFRYELLDTTTNNSALLASATSAGAFTTDGVALDRSMVHIAAKIVVHMRGALDLYAAYDARLSGNRSAQTAGLGMRYQFSVWAAANSRSTRCRPVAGRRVRLPLAAVHR